MPTSRTETPAQRAERIRSAHTTLRRNLRLAAKAAGMDLPFGLDAAPILAGTDLMHGVDCDLDEMLGYLTWKARRAELGRAMLERSAALGLAVETSMHEANTEFSHAQALLRRAAARLAEGSSDRKALEEASAGVQRVYDTVYKTGRLRQGADLRSTLIGASILDQTVALLGRGLDQARVRVEATAAFLSATLIGRDSLLVPVFVNLVRNAQYWALQAHPHAAHLRLDAHPVELMRPAWTDEDGTEQPPEPYSEWVFSVSDNGPGVPAERREAIFLPFESGRGSAGIGLHLCRINLESERLTLALAETPDDLGGARFLVGSVAALSPHPTDPDELRRRLVGAAVGIADMLAADRGAAVLAAHADDWAEVCREVLRVRLQGAVDALDARLLVAHDAVQERLVGRPRA